MQGEETPEASYVMSIFEERIITDIAPFFKMLVSVGQ